MVIKQTRRTLHVLAQERPDFWVPRWHPEMALNRTDLLRLYYDTDDAADYKTRNALHREIVRRARKRLAHAGIPHDKHDVAIPLVIMEADLRGEDLAWYIRLATEVFPERGLESPYRLAHIHPDALRAILRWRLGGRILLKTRRMRFPTAKRLCFNIAILRFARTRVQAEALLRYASAPWAVWTKHARILARCTPMTQAVGRLLLDEGLSAQTPMDTFAATLRNAAANPEYRVRAALIWPSLMRYLSTAEIAMIDKAIATARGVRAAACAAMSIPIDHIPEVPEGALAPYLAFKGLNKKEDMWVSPLQWTPWHYTFVNGVGLTITLTADQRPTRENSNGVYAADIEEASRYGTHLFLVAPMPETLCVLGTRGWRAEAAYVVHGPLETTNMVFAAAIVLRAWRAGLPQLWPILEWAARTLRQALFGKDS